MINFENFVLENLTNLSKNDRDMIFAHFDAFGTTVHLYKELTG